jgi:hypothetical protein
LQSKEEDLTPPRPRWQWVAFGSVITLSAWVPLAYVAEALVTHALTNAAGDHALWALPDATLGRLGALALVLPASSLVLASIAGGYVLARWGEGAALREAAEASALVVLFGVALVWARSTVRWESLAALALGVPSAILGASLGRRMRR